MKASKIPVYAAIPNYNMSKPLSLLLPTLMDRGFAHIYVLDDHSTDNSDQTVSKYGSKVTYYSSPKNMGAGATRNHILDYQKEGIVLFLDADMELLGSGDITDHIREAFKRHPDASVVGFNVVNPDGSQFEKNFGPTQSPKNIVTYTTWQLHQHTKNKHLKNILKHFFGQSWKAFWSIPHSAEEDREQQIGAVVECNMAVKLEDFAKVGGFDPRLRFHEIHDLAFKLKAINRTIWYVPEVKTLKHNEFNDVRPNRYKEMRDSTSLLYFKRISGRYKQHL